MRTHSNVRMRARFQVKHYARYARAITHTRTHERTHACTYARTADSYNGGNTQDGIASSVFPGTKMRDYEAVDPLPWYTAKSCARYRRGCVLAWRRRQFSESCVFLGGAKCRRLFRVYRRRCRRLALWNPCSVWWCRPGSSRSYPPSSFVRFTTIP